MCYAAAWPFLGWALLIIAGVSAEDTRVPFLIVEAGAVAVSVYGLRQKYGREFRPCPDCAETIPADAEVCRYCGFRLGRGDD